MSSPETTKKRKADDHQGGGDCESNAATDEGATTMAEILAEMKDMKLKMNDMKLEMDDMKGRLSRMDELENKCKSLEVKCDSLERSMKILTFDNKWEYSAPSIPTSYWVDQDLDEEYIEGMEYLLEQMEDRTIELRSGKCDIRKHILLSGGFEDTERFLLYYDVLLPHWKEFANALQLYQNCGGLLSFSICNVQLTPSVMDLLATALKGKTIFKKVELERNDFVNTREGIDFAVKLVKDNPKLEHFDWANNPIERMEDARYLVEAIISHPGIVGIRIENCLGEDINGYEILRSLFTSGRSFVAIDLEGNDIRTGGGTEISDYLATNPPLEYLFLSRNQLNDKDALLIASALKKNTILQRLRLGGNDITDIGRKALLNAVYDTTNFNAVSDCNHQCDIQGIDLGDIPNNDRGPNRARKIYHLLSLRNREGSNVQHLNLEFDDEDDSLALVPNVLASVHQYYHGSMFERHSDSDQVRPLSIMYEILRSWKMPQLYECRVMTTKK